MVTQAACGETFSLFLTSEGTLVVTGMLECEETEFEKNRDFVTPHAVPCPEPVIAIAAGSRYALLLTTPTPTNTTDTHVFLWKASGSADTPSVPLSSAPHSQRPVRVAVLDNKHITHCACGVSHCFVFSSATGRCFAWGVNTSGELGLGEPDEVAEPLEVPSPQGAKFVQVSCGNAFTVGITLPLKGDAMGESPSTIQFVADSLDAVREVRLAASPVRGVPDCFTFNSSEMERTASSMNSNGSCHSSVSSNKHIIA